MAKPLGVTGVWLAYGMIAYRDVSKKCLGLPGSAAAAAERMRTHRKRRREGSFIVRVQLDQPDIDGFVRLKLLQPGQRQDCRRYGKARPRF